MLQDLDSSLNELLIRYLPRVTDGNYRIDFEAPDQTNAAGINLFLYDVRENLELRSSISGFERQNDGTAIRKCAPARVDCSYLITAWLPDSEKSKAEHQLLGDVMKVLLRFPTLPPEVLQGSLQGQDPPVRVSSLRSGQLQGPGEYWQAIGGKPKAMLHYTVTISVPIDDGIEAVPLVLSRPSTSFGERSL